MKFLRLRCYGYCGCGCGQSFLPQTGVRSSICPESKFLPPEGTVINWILVLWQYFLNFVFWTYFYISLKSFANIIFHFFRSYSSTWRSRWESCDECWKFYVSTDKYHFIFLLLLVAIKLKYVQMFLGPNFAKIILKCLKVCIKAKILYFSK